MSRKISIAPHLMEERCGHEEALSRCFAAARLALRGERWGYTFQVDCAADLFTDLLTETLSQPATGTPQEVSRWIDFCWQFPLSAAKYADAETGIPRAKLSMTRLYGMASNWRRGHERAAERLRRAAVEGMSIADSALGAPVERPAATPTAARQTAIDALSELGLARLGKLYPVAYAAAREADGLTGDEIAAELGVNAATLRKQISRAGTKVPSAATHTYREHAETLRVDEYRPAGKRGEVKPMSGPESNDWRGAGAPVPVHPVKVSMAAPTAREWDGNRCADWAKDIPATTAARLAYAAKLQRERAKNADALDREARRAAAGIPQAS